MQVLRELPGTHKWMLFYDDETYMKYLTTYWYGLNNLEGFDGDDYWRQIWRPWDGRRHFTSIVTIFRERGQWSAHLMQSIQIHGTRRPLSRLSYMNCIYMNFRTTIWLLRKDHIYPFHSVETCPAWYFHFTIAFIITLDYGPYHCI